MNTIKKIRFALIAVLGLLTINSCVKDDDWSLPPVADCADSWTTDLTIEELFSMVDNAGQILAFDDERILEGYVVSSDSTGNFFKTVSIQNSLTNPTKGLQIEMDRPNLFNNFPLGSKIKVNLKGLHVGYDRGMLKIGDLFDNNTRVGRMAEVKIDGHVKQTCDPREYATPVQFNGIQDLLNNGVFNTLATINNVQFDDSELGNTYADAIGQLTVNRKLVDEEGKTIVLRNSGFATFAGDLMPEGSGSITVVISGYDTNNNGTVSPSEYQLFIRDTNDVNFNNPRFGEGGGSDPNEFFACLNEGFETYSEGNENFSKYENLAVTGGRKWRVTAFGGNQYIQVSAFNGSGSVVSYFVVPVNFSNADTFSFKSNDGYNNGDPLKVYYSTDYVPGGNISNATLVNITSSFNISTGHDSGYGPGFVESGDYSLSSLSGNGVIVFAYEGSSTGITTTMQIDDIKIVDSDDPDCGNGGGGQDPPSANAKPLFAGYNFEDWSAFLGGLNSFGLQDYATQSMGTGLEGSASLKIATDPATTNGNDYVFTSFATSETPSSYSKVIFFMKGTSDKSVSLNLYVDDTTYYKFNLGTLTEGQVIQQSGNNQYTGTINTGGQWIQITLDLTGITDLNTSNTSGNLFALKIGKNANYDLHFDNFTIE